MRCANCERELETGEEIVAIVHARAAELEAAAGALEQGAVQLVYGQSCCGPLGLALYLKEMRPLLGEIFFALAEGVEDLERAANGEYHCPKCERPLNGEFLYIDGLYTGVRLVCGSCGPIEYVGGSDDVW